MKRNNRKCTTETAPHIDIPPLVFRDSDANQQPVKPLGLKDASYFLNSGPLDKNTQFLKEKSLYRYTISRKGGRNDWNHSQTNLLADRQQLNRTSHISDAVSISGNISIKQFSVVSGHSYEGSTKERHFKRKTKYEAQGAQTVQANKTIGNTINKNAKIFQQEDLQKTTSTLSSKLRKLERCKSFLTKGGEDEIESLRHQVKRLRQENRYLREGYDRKCEQLSLMELQFKNIRLQNDQLIDKYSYSGYNDSFVNENKLENQIKLKDTLIVQLQDKLKYSQLQILTLKKLKIQQNSQNDLVAKLQKRNRNLEDRIDILTRIKTKRGNMSNSKLSEFSDMSLNFSADDEEFDKPYLALSTAQKTPEKIKIMKRRACEEILNQDELLTPLWAHRKK